jgi:putative membrane-bound dehydrogenase-like protein
MEGMIKNLLLALGLLIVFAVALGTRLPASPTDKFPPIVNTQDPKDKPPSPEDAARLITVPPGFRVTLFAGDPHVCQPIAIALDDRGRLWVAESYTYASRTWDKNHRDRLLIFEDTDHDGRFDKRTVFWDQAQNLSGVTTGFGGVWALCAPNLLFIPDRDGDDKPDGPPEIVLDGWALQGAGHNIVNGLTWGPDGWLYGRHGIMDTSRVGKPGTPDQQRVPINCGIWRYHPTRKVFEAVCHGTTNPWGLDYDDHGQMFFTNNVNGHLWHVIPGAHYKRMYGEDFNPRLYGLMGQHADHQHWDAKKSWTDSRDGKGEHGKRGGGHSHVGAMFYLGDNWPDHYRGTLFMCNTHGRRVNNDRLVRSGSGYLGLHGDDFLFANNPWFRGIDLKYGPDGGVYLSDWTDLGECHDHDGVHRTSGRIYKVFHGKPKPPARADVAKLTDAQLVKLHLHKNDWYVRAARRILQERAATGQSMRIAHVMLNEMFHQHKDVTRQLRALWSLYVTEGASAQWLCSKLGHENEHVRAWLVRLLTDRGAVDAETRGLLVDLAKKDRSGLVRLYLASALQRLPVSQRGDLAAALLDRSEDAADHNMPLMLWYGVEPLMSADPHRGVTLAEYSRIPLVRRHIARRLTEDIEKSAKPLDALLQVAANHSKTDFQLDVLQGMSDALRGWRKATAPAAWKLLQTKLATRPSKAVRELVRDLSVVFGDGRALTELRHIALDSAADGEARRAALRVLLDSRPDDLQELLVRLVPDRATIALAVRGLAGYDHANIPPLILRNYHYLRLEDRGEAMNTLTSRPAYAKALLDTIAAGKIPRGDLSAYHARQIHSLENKQLQQQLANVWGEIRATPDEKKQLIARYKKELTAERLKKANLGNGRLAYKQVCASCHVLYGDGQHLGPDLTGSGRENLDYLLENILDPSAVVPVEFKISVVVTKNGRSFNGVVGPKTDRTVTVQTQTERLNLERGDIDEIRATPLSLMPDGLLTPLTDDQVRDLIAYLIAREQVALPTEESKK